MKRLLYMWTASMVIGVFTSVIVPAQNETGSWPVSSPDGRLAVAIASERNSPTRLRHRLAPGGGWAARLTPR